MRRSELNKSSYNQYSFHVLLKADYLKELDFKNKLTATRSGETILNNV